MINILVLIPVESDGSPAKAGLETLTAASAVADAAVQIGLLGTDTAAANAVAGFGATRILSVAGPDFAEPHYATDAAGVAALIKASRAEVVLAPGTSRLARVLPGVAHRIGGCIDTHVTALESKDGKLLVTRWHYRQRMMAKITRGGRPWIISIDPGCFAPWHGAPGTAGAESVAVEITDAHRRTRVAGIQAPSADEQTIRPEAQLLFVAGAGWTKKQGDGKIHVKEAEALILGLVRGAKASLGSSKSLVDQAGEGQEVLSCLSHIHQVGQTGSTPRHAKGLATCCHGEEPHVVGWRFINERRAVNLDANCGWAQGKADVLYVADAFEVVQKVNKLLGE